MKFIADEMLGRLAKWLRIFGYDTLYLKDVGDSRLLRISLSEKRILLTRDRLLIRRRGIRNFLFITDDHPLDQVKQVVRELSLSFPKNPFTRCVLCNSPLIPFSKEEACKIVPDYVCRTQEVFGQCPECKRVYWKGTHYERMVGILKKIFMEEV